MYRKWKSISALGLAALMVCLIPMGTMKAAEENAKAVQETAADVVGDESILDEEAADKGNTGDGNIGDESNTGDGNIGDESNTGDENIGDESNAGNGNIGDESNTGDENIGDEGNAGSNENIGNEDNTDDGESISDIANIKDESIEDKEAATVETAKAPEEKTAEAPVSVAAPSINIKWWNNEPTYELGGKIDFRYVRYQGYSIDCSVDQADTVYYYLDKVTDMSAEAKGKEQMDSLSWIDEIPENIILLNEGNYVLYVKAEADGQITYARSGGIVVDTVAPEIIGVEEGKSYPEGTTFKVTDSNLESVKVNEKMVTPASDGSYQVRANGVSTSCVIRVVDKAGNEKTCNVTVSGKDPGGKAISEDGIYALKAGVRYQLAEGKWRVNGDSTVYRGGSTFYVRTDGDYRLTKR